MTSSDDVIGVIPDSGGILNLARFHHGLMDCAHFWYRGVSGREESNGVVSFRR